MALLRSSDEKLKPGMKAPDFALKNVDGKVVKLSDFKGMAVAVIFICNHCPYVIPKMEEIASLMRDYNGKVAVLGINSNDPVNYPADNFESMQRMARQKGFSYYLFDESQAVAKSYGAVCTPDPYLFDKEHKLVYHGRINDAMDPDDSPTKHELKEAIEALLSGKPLQKWFVPSQGCSIKWK